MGGTDAAVARAKRMGRSAAFGFGRLTHAQRMLPNLLIVGAQRCGTTGLFRALADHPQVHGPVLRKGIHYFDVDYTKPLSWYQAHFPLRAAVMRTADHAQPAVLEASPYYMFHPAVPDRIARDLPGVRALVLLRDPVSRAYSAYKHEVSRGFETLDFAEALAAERARLAGEEERLVADPGYVSHAHQHQAYVARGRYVVQLERLEKAIGRDRILVVDSQRYFREPDRTIGEVYEFLGLPARPHPDVFRNESSGGSGMPADLRAQLRETFREDDERLRDWLGWTPSWLQ